MANVKTTVQFPILGILTIVFVVLKLTDHIDWSWWWVLSPLWIPFVLIFAFVGIVAILAASTK